MGEFALLKEDGDALLKEDADKLLKEDAPDRVPRHPFVSYQVPAIY